MSRSSNAIIDVAMCVDRRIMHSRAAVAANRLVVDHEAFGDAETILRLADFVERTPLPKSLDLRDMVVQELRARAALVAAAYGRDRVGA